MTAKPDCERARRRLPDIVEGPVDAELLEHFRACTLCTEELRAFRAAVEAAGDLSERDIPDPGEAYWEQFLPSVRARIARRAGEGERRAARSRSVAAAGLVLMIAAATVALLLPSFRSSRAGSAANRLTATVSLDEASRRLDEALGHAPESSGELVADVIGIDPLPQIGASEMLEALKEIDRPPSLSGSWADLEDDELQRLLDGLDTPQTLELRAELSAENG